MKVNKTYRKQGDYSVIEGGTIVIDSVFHLVTSGYVECSPSLNHKAWDVTQGSTYCELCYPRIKQANIQLSLF